MAGAQKISYDTFEDRGPYFKSNPSNLSSPVRVKAPLLEF
jgi:hypothetical protein